MHLPGRVETLRRPLATALMRLVLRACSTPQSQPALKHNHLSLLTTLMMLKVVGKYLVAFGCGHKPLPSSIVSIVLHLVEAELERLILLVTGPSMLLSQRREGKAHEYPKADARRECGLHSTLMNAQLRGCGTASSSTTPTRNRQPPCVMRNYCSTICMLSCKYRLGKITDRWYTLRGDLRPSAHCNASLGRAAKDHDSRVWLGLAIASKLPADAVQVSTFASGLKIVTDHNFTVMLEGRSILGAHIRRHGPVDRNVCACISTALHIRLICR